MLTYDDYHLPPNAGRAIKEDGSLINLADVADDIRTQDAFGHGEKDVASHGTAVQLDTDCPCHHVQIMAKDDNAGTIYIGNSTVSSSSFGRKLSATEGPVIIEVSNLNLIWIDSSDDDDGVTFLYW